MRTCLSILLFLAAAPVFSQPEVFLGGAYQYSFLPRLKEIRLAVSDGFVTRRADGDPELYALGLNLEVEVRLRRERKRFTPYAGIGLGRVLRADLGANYTAPGVQVVDGELREGMLSAQTRMTGVYYTQAALGVDMLLIPEWNDFTMGLGVGGLLMLRQDIHGAATWYDPETERAYAANLPARIEEGMLRQDRTAVGASPGGLLTLDKLYFQKTTPYLEVRASARRSPRSEEYAVFQYGLTNLVNEGVFPEAPGRQRWVVLKVGIRGRLF